MKKKVWIQSIKELEWVTPHIVCVVSIIESIICIVLLVGKEQIWIEFVPTIWWPSWR